MKEEGRGTLAPWGLLKSLVAPSGAAEERRKQPQIGALAAKNGPAIDREKRDARKECTCVLGVAFSTSANNSLLRK